MKASQQHGRTPGMVVVVGRKDAVEGTTFRLSESRVKRNGIAPAITASRFSHGGRMATSNTLDVFREGIGQKIVGLYTENSQHAGKVVVLVLENGTGIAFGTANGSHWNIDPIDLHMRALARREELERLTADLRDVRKAEAALP